MDFRGRRVAQGACIFWNGASSNCRGIASHGNCGPITCCFPQATVKDAREEAQQHLRVWVITIEQHDATERLPETINPFIGTKAPVGLPSERILREDSIRGPGLLMRSAICGAEDRTTSPHFSHGQLLCDGDRRGLAKATRSRGAEGAAGDLTLSVSVGPYW